jgi:hypothetical protein
MERSNERVNDRLSEEGADGPTSGRGRGGWLKVVQARLKFDVAEDLD